NKKLPSPKSSRKSSRSSASSRATRNPKPASKAVPTT
ncbi:hypothetical protein CT0861_13269, partial [Colletotrichum tofieldiae]